MVRKRVLLVDDDRQVRELTRFIIESEIPLEVYEATNGKDAFDLLQNKEYDLLITDIYMPEMDGIELIYKLKAAGSSIPIIVVSGGLNHHTRELLSSMESIHVFGKPFSVNKLVEIIKNVITSRI